MSWDIYIDNIIGQSVDYVGTLHCERACIIGLDGKTWTSHSHPCSLKLSPSEAQTIADGMKTNNTKLFDGGVVIESMTYQFLKNDGNAITSKKGLRFLTMQRSLLAVVIGLGSEGGEQGYINKAVSFVADYLRKKEL